MLNKTAVKYEVSAESAKSEWLNDQREASSEHLRKPDRPVIVDDYENKKVNCCQRYLERENESSSGMKMHEVIKILVLGPGKLCLLGKFPY